MVAAKLGIGAFALVLLFGTVETIARVHRGFRERSEDGWNWGALSLERSVNSRINATLTPSAEYLWGGVPIKINSHGLRDKELVFQKEPQTRRVLCLGDSVTFGWRVRVEEAYPKGLEALLRAESNGFYEVINAGVPGWDQPIELAYLQQTGLKYRPDLIIAGVTVANDIYHTTWQFPKPSVKTWLHEHTDILSFLAYLRVKVRPVATSTASAATPAYPFPVDKSDQIWSEYITDPILTMAQVAKESGAEFIVVVFPTVDQVRSDAYPATAQEIIGELGRTHGITVVDLLPRWMDVYAKDPGAKIIGQEGLFSDLVHHPGELGHRLASNAIYETIVKQRILEGN